MPKKPDSRPVVIDGGKLTLEAVEAIADGRSCRLSAAAKQRTRQARAVVDRAIAGGDAVYGVNTGFGSLSSVRIPDDRLDELQRNLIRSHCAGVGDPLPERTVRAILALRANCLARGNSGLRLKTLERLATFLQRGIHPVVPERGSVGASGDLAPLAHIALAVIGEGEVFHRGRRKSTGAALRAEGLKPLTLRAKEGLTLINGTQVMTAIGTLSLLQAERLTRLADIAGAMSIDALLGTHRAFDRRIHEARAHPGQRDSAANLRRLLRNSPLERSHHDCGQVQDCYSLRCMPQIHGATRDALRHIRGVLEIEVNASTDNPMVFLDRGELVSGGNFHGQPISLALDHLATATCTIGTVAERRLERLVNPDHSGLPAFLAHDPGLHSGFMIAQVTAAALVSENKTLAHPASVDTIPTSANKEDHVSMGVNAAHKAARIVDNVTTVLAIEWMAAAQALDLRLPLIGGRGVEAARQAFRDRVAHLGEDRVVAGDIAIATEALRDGSLLEAVQAVSGRLA